MLIEPNSRNKPQEAFIERRESSELEAKTTLLTHLICGEVSPKQREWSVGRNEDAIKCVNALLRNSQLAHHYRTA